MKQLLIIISIFYASSSISFGQKSKQIDSVIFCAKKYKVPIDCKAKSENQISGKNFTMTWTNINETFITGPEQYLNTLSSKMKDFKKDTIVCYILDKEVKAYKVHFKTTANKIVYQIITYFEMKDEGLLIILSLNSNPKINNDIPQFCRQILKLR